MHMDSLLNKKLTNEYARHPNSWSAHQVIRTFGCSKQEALLSRTFVL